MNIKTLTILTSLLFSTFLLNAQLQKAYLEKDNKVNSIIIKESGGIKSHKADQLSNWPKAFESNQSFKNMRGVCLQDLDGNGSEEIIFGANDSVYVFSGDGTKLWSSAILGTVIYPPAAADIDNDGDIEIVFVTGGVPNNGHIHVFDHLGNEVEGWPQSIDDHWLICSPSLADLNGDRDLEILVAERDTPGRLHIFKNDGSNFSENWPAELDGYPAVTPSVAYDYKHRDNIPNEGLVNDLIVMCSTNSLYAFDTEGNTYTGFPVENSNTKFSYQSPLICHEWDNYQIIGGTHGDLPEFYSFNLQGEYTSANWPNPTADDSWTYNAPLAIGQGNTFDFYIFAQPGADGTTPYPTIHAFNPDGSYIDGFPFERTDGLEGFITAMYSTDLTKIYIFTGSNMKDVDGNGFIHAYSANTDLSDFTEISGFPILVQGFTFMNGINLGDVNNNGKLDLVALSYDQNFESTDSIHINVFEMSGIDYNADYCFNTYKGNNLRNGYVTPFGFNANINLPELNNIKVFPSLITDKLNIDSNTRFDIEIYNSSGVLSYKQSDCEKKCIFSFENYSEGMYFVKISQNNKTYTYKVIKLK